MISSFHLRQQGHHLCSTSLRCWMNFFFRALPCLAMLVRRPLLHCFCGCFPLRRSCLSLLPSFDRCGDICRSPLSLSSFSSVHRFLYLPFLFHSGIQLHLLPNLSYFPREFLQPYESLPSSTSLCRLFVSGRCLSVRLPPSANSLFFFSTFFPRRRFSLRGLRPHLFIFLCGE